MVIIMRMYDLIEKKKRGGELSGEEICAMVEEYTAGRIPDYQMSAMLMAVYFQGMGTRELSDLTLCMAHSGNMADLSDISGFTVDKHSTGGVGDKTTLIVGPAVAACGVKVAKMSGRGLGHTGGTIDKLESIPHFRTDLSREEFFRNVETIGISVTGQSKNFVPADQKMYALRDVTATVDSIPLIAASVMSKKLAAGSDGILLDVTCGSGAFMKKTEDAKTLAGLMTEIGWQSGKKTAALITNMDVPLGEAIGNSLEVAEAIEVLKGRGPEDLREVCVALAAEMLALAGVGALDCCRDKICRALDCGAAYQRFLAMIQAQTDGDEEAEALLSQLPQAAYHYELVSDCRGYVVHMDTERCGAASMLLGAGRETKDDVIDPAAGIVLKKKTGDFAEPGDTLAVLYSKSYDRIYQAGQVLRAAYEIGDQRPEEKPLILGRIASRELN